MTVFLQRYQNPNTSSNFLFTSDQTDLFACVTSAQCKARGKKYVAFYLNKTVYVPFSPMLTIEQQFAQKEQEIPWTSQGI